MSHHFDTLTAKEDPRINVCDVSDPATYAERLIARLCPTILPYHLDTLDFIGFNGRALTDDVMDVILTLATNTALGDGVVPDKGRE